MNRALLNRVGESLYGESPGWHEPLAYDLSVDLRTMQRWASGKRDIPPAIQGELAALCHEAARELGPLAVELGYGMEPAIDERLGVSGR